MVDLCSRIEQLETFVNDHNLGAVWFARPNGFAWLTGGNNVVDASASIGVAAAGYDGDLRIITSNIERERLIEEEIPDAFIVESFPWYEETLAGAITNRSPKPAAADFNVSGLELIDGGTIRQPLTDDDIDQYRMLCQETATVVETICRNLESQDTENEIATEIKTVLSSHDITTPVVLVAGADRAQKYRHYTPTNNQVSNYALISLTAQRGGLYVSMTRTVAFEAPGWLETRHHAAARIEATAIAATKAAIAGNLSNTIKKPDTSGDIFAVIRQAYEQVGFPDEWQLHHQGGAAGFAGREWVALPNGQEQVQQPMAYAWNPTINGAKSEDTHLIAIDHTERLTETGNWPTRKFESVNISDIPVIKQELTVPMVR